MLKASEVAPLLGLSESKVLLLARKGLIAHYRMDKAVRFTRADVEEYLARQRPPELSVRELRVAALLSARAGQESPLTPEQQALVDARHRHVRRPPWADSKAMKAFHLEARRLTAETGIKHHVDHIIPLQGELVSGLHVHTNMQVLPGIDNLRKKNRFEPC